jgi:serine/threonine-protein kinase
MGAVYLANDIRLDRHVALKVLPAEFATDVGLRERFLRETRTAASFSHPNIVPVHSVEEDGASLAFVMGFVEGESLGARVGRMGPLDAKSVVRLLQDVAYALAYAHGRGVVHRDIKPDNVMIERATGRALVMDFGIARAMTPTAAAPGLTRVGEIVGTPEYMSPEQASGDNIDGRSDIYSLGLVALFAITGRAPITGDSYQQLIVKQLTEQLPAAISLRPDLPVALCDAIDRCVAKEPGQRWLSAEALVEALDNAKLAGPEIPLAIRLFSQEAATLGLITAFAVVLSAVFYTGLSADAGSIDALLPIVMLAGVVFTRVLQARSEAGRIARAGFAVGDVLAGMAAVLDERAVARQVVALDPEVRGRRKRTVIIASLMIPFAYLLLRLALAMREQVGPHSYRVGFMGVFMVFSAFAMAGIGLVLLLRSPFRAPVGERLFRLVWLGAFGRWFLRGAMKQTGGGTSAPRTSPNNARPAPTAAAVVRTQPQLSAPSQPTTFVPDERLERIEAMLTELTRRLDKR